MTIKLKYNKERFILFAILALCIFSCLILPGMITMLLSVLAMGYMAVAEKNALVKKNKITNSLFLVEFGCSPTCACDSCFRFK